ncbi:30S ribosomal protein S3, partial [Enterococcus faecalis]|nr:30S ribosomal protein S3 [Enterococcus faecalis]
VFLHEDLTIRKFITTLLFDPAVSTIKIERAAICVIILVHTAIPGTVTDKCPSVVEDLRDDVFNFTANLL